MAHEIGEHDGLVLVKQSAWHGLGLVVPDAMTPRKALALIGADNQTDRRELYFRDSFGVEHAVPTHVVNVREVAGADPIQHGVVSASYQIIQNLQMAEFCESLAEAGIGEVKCETVGTIRNGGKIWFLLRGETFQVGKGDTIYPYVLASNGHDGMTTYRITPTTVRAVCSNTLHMTIPRFDTGELGQSAISIRHTANAMDRLEEAKLALKHYGEVLDEEKVLMNKLSKTDVSSEAVQQFFLACYTADFGDIPENPTTKVEENRRNRAMSAWNSFSRRFDDEKGIAGTSWWCAANSYSGMIQHDMKARGKDDSDRIEKRIDSNLFGLSQQRTQDALQRAFKMSLV